MRISHVNSLVPSLSSSNGGNRVHVSLAESFQLLAKLVFMLIWRFTRGKTNLLRFFTYLTLLPNTSVSRCRAADPSFGSNRTSKIQKPSKY